MANLLRNDPYEDVFDNLLRGFFVRPVVGESTTAAPRLKVEVAEQNGAFKVVAEIPGAKKEDIQVAINGDQVSITAEIRKEREAKEGERVIHSERYYGKVARAFQLGAELDESKAQAKYTDGVLELTLPKKVAASARRLTIQ
jgi:HSP20 family protein